MELHKYHIIFRCHFVLKFDEQKDNTFKITLENQEQNLLIFQKKTVDPSGNVTKASIVQFYLLSINIVTLCKLVNVAFEKKRSECNQ